MKRISVIVPVYNVEKYLPGALKSIELQTIGLQNLEVIMVNDGSPDGCKDIMDSYAKKHANFHAIHLQSPSGAAGRPRNIGMQMATGDYIMFLDPDDYYEDTACETLYNHITQYSADMGRGNFLARSSYSSFEHSNVNYFPVHTKYINGIDEFKLFYRLTPAVWASIFRRDFILKNNLQFPEKIAGQDMVFIINALLLAKGIFFTKTRVANYRVRDGEDKSISMDVNFKFFQSMSSAQKLTYDLFCKFNKENDYSHLLVAHTTYYINKFINADGLKAEEKLEALRGFHWYFQLVKKLDAYPDDVKSRFLIDKIINEEYMSAIAIMDYFKYNNLQASYPVVSKQKSNSEAQAELDRIYNMRTWKMIEKYRNFAQNTRFGRFVRRVIIKVFAGTTR